METISASANKEKESLWLKIRTRLKPHRETVSWFLSLYLIFLIILVLSVAYFRQAIFPREGVPRLGGISWMQPEIKGVQPGVGLSTDFVILGVAVALILLFLACLPLFLVLRYKRVEESGLVNKLGEDLWLCGFDGEQGQVTEFCKRNGWGAFFFPMFIMTIYLYLMFGSILMSHGVYGIVVSFASEACLLPDKTDPTKCLAAAVDVPQFLFNLPRTAAPISWTFLGAYFYCISVILRRWQRSDLTTVTLWKLTVRFAVAFILGLLLTKITPCGASAKPILPAIGISGTEFGLALCSMPDTEWAIIAALTGFMIGIVPDGFISRVFARVRNQFENEESPVKPSDLHKKIDGLNFWQEDRLIEEGIETVEDLAMTDITDLLVKIRFDTPHLLCWVDQALLCHQAQTEYCILRAAHILTATDLLYLTGHEASNHILQGESDPKKLERIWKSLEGAGSVADEFCKDHKMHASISMESLMNIVDGLRNTPNVPFVWAYMTNTRNLNTREKRLEEYRKKKTKKQSSQSQEYPSFLDD